MEPTGAALRADTITSAVIVFKAGFLCHECFKSLQLSGCHVAHLLVSFLRRIAVSANGRSIQLLGNKKRGFASYSKMENETNPLSFLDDFLNCMNDTEQYPDDQGKSPNETSKDDVQGKYSNCAGYTVAEGDQPEAHPPYPKRKAYTQPEKEKVAYAVCHIDRLKERCEAEC